MIQFKEKPSVAFVPCHDFDLENGSKGVVGFDSFNNTPVVELINRKDAYICCNWNELAFILTSAMSDEIRKEQERSY